jgi:Na+-driven multidrug efflux pump
MAPGMICVTIFGNTLDFSSVWFWVCLGIDLTMILTVNVIYWRGRLKKRASEQNTCESTEESEHEVSQG